MMSGCCGYPIELNDLKMFMQRNGDLMVVLSPSEIFAYASERLSNEDNVLLNKMFKSNDEDQNPSLTIHSAEITGLIEALLF